MRDQNDNASRACFSQTPLHLAALTRQGQLVRRLVIAGATLDKRDRRGNTPLHLACETGDLDSAKAILQPILPSELREVSGLLSYRTQVAATLQPSDLIDETNNDGTLQSRSRTSSCD